MTTFKTDEFKFLLLEAYFELEINQKIRLYDEDGLPTIGYEDRISHMKWAWDNSDVFTLESFKKIAGNIESYDFLSAMYAIESRIKLTDESYDEAFWGIISSYVDVSDCLCKYSLSYTLRRAMECYGYAEYSWPYLDTQTRIYEIQKYFLENKLGTTACFWVDLFTLSEERLLTMERILMQGLTPEQKFYCGLKSLNPKINMACLAEKAEEYGLKKIREKIDKILSPDQKKVFNFWTENMWYDFTTYEKECLEKAALSISSEFRLYDKSKEEERKEEEERYFHDNYDYGDYDCSYDYTEEEEGVE